MFTIFPLLDISSPMLATDPLFCRHVEKLNIQMKLHIGACQEKMRLLGAVEQIFTLLTPAPTPALQQAPPVVEDTESEGVVDDEEKSGDDAYDMKKTELEEDEKSTRTTTTDNDVDFQIRERSVEIVIDD